MKSVPPPTTPDLVRATLAWLAQIRFCFLSDDKVEGLRYAPYMAVLGPRTEKMPGWVMLVRGGGHLSGGSCVLERWCTYGNGRAGYLWGQSVAQVWNVWKFPLHAVRQSFGKATCWERGH